MSATSMWHRFPWLAALMLLLASGCSEDAASDTTIIKSSDGKAQLEVPAGALPAGVSADSVKIEPVSVEATGLYSSDGSVKFFATYRLSPDGVKLSSAATVRLTVSSADMAGLVHALHITSEGDAELAPLSQISDDGTVTALLVQVEHFSDVALFTVSSGYKALRGLIMKVDITPASGATVQTGVQFPVTLKYTFQSKEALTFEKKGDRGRLLSLFAMPESGILYSASGIISDYGSQALTPGRHIFVPFGDGNHPFELMPKEHSVNWTCTKDGTANWLLYGSIKYQYKLVYYIAGKEKVVGISNASAQFNERYSYVCAGGVVAKDSGPAGPCDPLNNKGCTAPSACYFSALGKTCMTAGTKATGSKCTSENDCAPKNACLTVQGMTECCLLCAQPGSKCATGAPCMELPGAPGFGACPN